MHERIKRILVYMDDQRRTKAATEYACRLAQTGDADISGRHVLVEQDLTLMTPEPGMAMMPNAIEKHQEDSEKNAEKLEVAFKDVIDAHNVDATWKIVESEAAEIWRAIAEDIYASDLIVVGTSDKSDDMSAPGLIDDLVLNAGRPVVLIPEDWSSGKDAPEHVMVAWKLNRQSARAVHDALPFMQMAKNVSVVTVTDNDETNDPEFRVERLLEMLEAHDIHAKTVRLDSENGITEALNTYTTQHDVDLMVLGAYSRSRLSEGIFGGVTKDCINTCVVPTLLSH